MGYSSIEKTSRLPECSLGGLVCNASYSHPQHGLCRSEATGLMNGTKPSAKTELGNSKYAFLDLSLGASPEFGKQGLDGGGEAARTVTNNHTFVAHRRGSDHISTGVRSAIDARR